MVKTAKKRPATGSSKNVPPVVIHKDDPLIPATCASSAEGTQSFSTGFATRHCANGAPVPPFFIGSLQEAISEAFDKPLIADRRPLVLYIHRDGEACRCAFDEELCFDETVALLRSNFVLWPWDVTTKENQLKLISWLIECDLYEVISAVASDLELTNDSAFSLMLPVVKYEDTLYLNRKSGTHHKGNKIYDTLGDVWTNYADHEDGEVDVKSEPEDNE